MPFADSDDLSYTYRSAFFFGPTGQQLFGPWRLWLVPNLGMRHGLDGAVNRVSRR